LNDGKPNHDDNYWNAAQIPPTSVVVESLFSESGYMFDDRRLATTPEHIEQLMFLKTNRFIWDIELVAKHVVNGLLRVEPDEDHNDSEVEIVGAEGQ
jgi:hypothetical protein